MKVIFLSFYSGRVYRGVETFVYEIGKELIKRGNKVIVFQSGNELPGSTFKTIKVESSNILEFTKKVLKMLPKDSEIIFPNNGRWQTILCRIWCIINKKKMVVVGHSGPGWDDRLNLLLFPDVFVSLTKVQEKWVKNVNPFVKTLVIPDGANTSIFTNSVSKIEVGIPGPIILYVAALSKIKRVHLAIKAVAGLSKGSLLVIGDGEEKNYLNSLGNKLLPGRFAIKSFKYEKMPSVYASAKIFTYPTSSWESTGLSLIEAMASNLPIVSTNDPIRKEIIGEAGLFVDPENIKEYSRSLQRALSKNWNNIPRLRAEKFSWQSISEKYEDLFKQLVGKK